jgi:mono/diheme cytochrome c family protein
MLRSIFAFALLFVVSAWGTNQPVIHQVPIKRTSWASGQQMYHEYCAACHGVKADGNGPAAPACKVKPSNLTLMTRNNGGKFPYNYFYSVVQFGTPMPTPAHGTADMPIWLPLFISLDNGRQGIELQRMHNIASYVESLQRK